MKARLARLGESVLTAALVLGVLALVFLATGGSCTSGNSAVVCSWSAD